jgi:ArsR family transcriptional regulator
MNILVISDISHYKGHKAGITIFIKDLCMKAHKLTLDFETQEANLLKLLAHPVRIAIIKILRQGEACVCHIEATLGVRQAYLSQQLAVLREAGIISDRRDGWNVFYQIQDQQVLDILDISAKIIQPGNSEIPLKPVSCPCPKCTTSQNKVSYHHSIEKEN